jgi:hypothetical protein
MTVVPTGLSLRSGVVTTQRHVPTVVQHDKPKVEVVSNNKNNKRNSIGERKESKKEEPWISIYLWKQCSTFVNVFSLSNNKKTLENHIFHFVFV